jgi:HEAT repeat protein
MLQSLARALPTLVAGALILVTGCQPPPAANEVEDLLRRHEYAKAQAKVQQALTHQPKSAALWKLRLRVHLAQGQRREAVEAYRERALNYGQDLELLHGLAVAIIASGLESRVPEVRIAAIQAARETDAAELEQAVAARLADPDPIVRTWAAVALSGRPDGVEVLDQQLQGSNARAREIVVRELGRLAGAAALRNLVRAASAPDARVRAAAASALGSLRKPEVVPTLRQLLGDPDPGVRASAARSAEMLKSSALALELRRMTTDQHLSARLCAVSALAAVGDGEAKPALQSLATSDDLFTAMRAGAQLARLGDTQPVLDAVARALVDKHWTMRVAACTTVSMLHDRVGLQLVEKATRDPEPRVRLAAARTLLAGRPDLREPAVRTALSVQQLSCAKAARTAGLGDLCVDASDLLVRAGNGSGMEMLKDLTRHGATAELRLSALRSALMLAPNKWLALDGLGDAEMLNALYAASWTYRRAK